MNENFKGAWPALITPAAPNGDVNIDVLTKLVEHLMSKNIGGLYLSGSTGEGTLLSVAEILFELAKYSRLPRIIG